MKLKSVGIRLAVCGLVAVIASGGAGAATYRDGDRVVFFGDSITHGAGYPETVSLYYATRFPERDIRFFNAGWGGAAATQAFHAIDEDVVACRPTVVSVMFGMNDCGYWNLKRCGMTKAERDSRQRHIDRYAELMPKLIADIRKRAGNPRIQYVTPSPYEQNAVYQGEQGANVANDSLFEMAALVRGWAKADGADLIDLQDGLLRVDEREQMLDPSFSVLAKDNGTLDRVHPGSLGYTLFAYFWLKAQGAPSVVARLEIDARTARPGACENATVSDLSVASNAVTFAAVEKALPYPLEGTARRAAALVPFMEDLNRETLIVRGLAPGGYDILIDGRKVGSRSAAELARGVEMAGWTTTPQYRQACAVMKANSDHWSATRTIRDFVTRRRWMRMHYHIDPDDPAAVRRHIEDLQSKNNLGYDYKMAVFYEKNWPRNAVLLEGMEKNRAKTRTLAQPVEHKWTIRPAEASKK